jgi:hypothetical protein
MLATVGEKSTVYSVAAEKIAISNYFIARVIDDIETRHFYNLTQPVQGFM